MNRARGSSRSRRSKRNISSSRHLSNTPPRSLGRLQGCWASCDVVHEKWPAIFSFFYPLFLVQWLGCTRHQRAKTSRFFFPPIFFPFSPSRLLSTAPTIPCSPYGCRCHPIPTSTTCRITHTQPRLPIVELTSSHADGFSSFVFFASFTFGEHLRANVPVRTYVHPACIYIID